MGAQESKLAQRKRDLEVTEWEHFTETRSQWLTILRIYNAEMAIQTLSNFSDAATADTKKTETSEPSWDDAEDRWKSHQATHNRKGKIYRYLWRKKTGHDVWKSATTFEDVRKPLASLLLHVRDLDKEMDKGTEGYSSAHVIDWAKTLVPFCKKKLSELRRQQTEEEKTAPSDDIFHMPKADQKKICRALLKKIGFDFDRGQIAEAEHPICLGTHDDVRIAMRYDEQNFIEMILSTWHEGGHAFYRQNLPADKKDMLAGGVASIAVDESMALLFENHIGRAKGGAQIVYDLICNELGEPYASRLSPQAIYHKMTRLEPHGLRTAADEIRYPLDIIHRFKLIKGLKEKTIRTRNLSKEFNKTFRDMTGISIRNDKDGVLQDPHLFVDQVRWLLSYLPGALGAAQLYRTFCGTKPDTAKALTQYGGVQSDLSELNPLFDWLKDNICANAGRYQTFNLFKKVTGKKLGTEDFIAEINDKYDVQPSFSYARNLPKIVKMTP